LGSEEGKRNALSEKVQGRVVCMSGKGRETWKNLGKAAPEDWG